MDLANMRAAGYRPNGVVTVFGKATPHWRLRQALMDVGRMVIDHDDGEVPLPLLANLNVLLMLDCDRCLEVALALEDAPQKPYRCEHYCERCGLSSFVGAG